MDRYQIYMIKYIYIYIYIYIYSKKYQCIYIYLNKCQLPMCYLKCMDKKEHSNLFKITNISLLFGSFIDVK